MKKWIVILASSALLGLIVYRAANNYQAKKQAMNQPVQEKVVPVTVMQPRHGEIVETLVASANLQANAELTIFSKVSGKIIANLVRLGSEVQPGEVVATVNRDEVGYEYKEYEVKSSVRGVVSRVLQNPGSAINPSTPLINLVDVDTVKAMAAVDEMKIRFIARGQAATVRVQAFPDELFQARVRAISPISNPATRTIDIEVSIANRNHRLKPGMYATVQLVESRRTALLLPISCLVERAGGKYVFRVQGDRAVLQSVTAGSVQKDEIEIVSGLQGTENVIAAGANQLDERDKITIVKQN